MLRKLFSPAAVAVFFYTSLACAGPAQTLQPRNADGSLGAGHEDHFHLRLKCSPYHPLCLQQGDIAPGTGCP